jgi:hypothetical protein
MRRAENSSHTILNAYIIITYYCLNVTVGCNVHCENIQDYTYSVHIDKKSSYGILQKAADTI